MGRVLGRAGPDLLRPAGSTHEFLTEYTIRQAAYDLRKLRGKQLVVKPGRGHRYLVPAEAAHTLTGLVSLRDHVIAPVSYTHLTLPTTPYV